VGLSGDGGVRSYILLRLDQRHGKTISSIPRKAVCSNWNAKKNLQVTGVLRTSAKYPAAEVYSGIPDLADAEGACCPSQKAPSPINPPIQFLNLELQPSGPLSRSNTSGRGTPLTHATPYPVTASLRRIDPHTFGARELRHLFNPTLTTGRECCFRSYWFHTLVRRAVLSRSNEMRLARCLSHT